MAIDHRDELLAFHRFLGETLSDGGDVPTPEECLALWRAEHPSEAELDASIRAVAAAFDDARAGRVRPLDEFDRSFRGTHGIPPGP